MNSKTLKTYWRDTCSQGREGQSNMSVGINVPTAPDAVPVTVRDSYFEILGMISEMGLKDQEFVSVKNNIFYFTDYLFFWTPKKYLVLPRADAELATSEEDQSENFADMRSMQSR